MTGLLPMRTSNPADLALLDTNVLVYADQEEEEYHRAAKMLRDLGQRGDIPVCISPQVLSGFFAVVTRAGRHRASSPMSPAEAAEEVRKYLEAEHINKIYPTPTTWPTILSLLEQHSVTGQDIHDLHLAATMLSNDVTKIYTFNTEDFASIPGIEVLDPLAAEIAARGEDEEPESPNTG